MSIHSKIREHHYLSILLAQIMLLFICPFMPYHESLIILFVIGMFGVFGTLLAKIWGKRLLRYVSLLMGIIAFVGVQLAIYDSFEINPGIPLAASGMAYTIFMGICIVSIGRYVLVTDKITMNIILGGICIYLLIGMFFGFFYGTLAIIIPHSYRIGPAPEGPTLLRINDFLCYSFGRLTTSGDYDVLPTNSLTRMLAAFESIVGTLYVAVMVARLVGMHISQGRQHEKV